MPFYRFAPGAVIRCSLLLFVLGFYIPAWSASLKPNIIILVADDLGYGDLGIQGGTDIPTPHLDALARSGVRCTSGYASAPVCSPTRAGLLTGRYQQAFGFVNLPYRPGTGLPPTEKTIAGLLKPAGYVSKAIGKWHVGQLDQYHPLSLGFDEFYGFLGGGRSYLPLKDSPNLPFVPKDPRQVGLQRNRESIEDPEHLTDAFGEEAVAFIEAQKKNPFLIYVAFNAVHLPMQAHPKYLARFPQLSGPRKIYAAMLSAMDDAVGRITSKIKDEKLDERTMIFFLSDNGGHPIASTASNKPLRDQKGSTFEGGIRVPFFMKWSGTIPAGKTYDHPVICMDIVTTAVQASGAKVPANLDGIDLVPYLTGKNTQAPHDALYWKYSDYRAVRHGKWKFTAEGEQAPALFDLSSDIGESKDLSKTHPEVLQELLKKYEAWNAKLPPPLWEDDWGKRAKSKKL